MESSTPSRDTAWAMSEENVATIRRGYEAMNSALASGEDLLSLMGGIDPDVVVEMGVLEGTFHGREGFVQFIEGQAAVFETCAATPRRSSTRARTSSFRCA
jgi:hypothetical protein